MPVGRRVTARHGLAGESVLEGGVASAIDADVFESEIFCDACQFADVAVHQWLMTISAMLASVNAAKIDMTIAPT